MIDEQLRKNFLASIIASIVVIFFIQPILKLIWSCTIFVSNHLYEGYTKAIYRSAALGDRNDVIVGLMIFFTAIMFGIISGIPFGYLSAKRLSDKVKSIMIGKRLFVLAYFLSIIFLLCFLFGFVIPRFVDLQLNTSFQQRLTVLAPTISDIELKELKASWAQMQSRKDYELIKDRMDNMAKLNGIDLPAPLLK